MWNKARPPLVSQRMREFRKQWSWSKDIGFNTKPHYNPLFLSLSLSSHSLDFHFHPLPHQNGRFPIIIHASSSHSHLRRNGRKLETFRRGIVSKLGFPMISAIAATLGFFLRACPAHLDPPRVVTLSLLYTCFYITSSISSNDVTY